MRWKKKKKLGDVSPQLSQSGKLLDIKDSSKIKGGKARKDKIWNGCGGIIPQ